MFWLITLIFINSNFFSLFFTQWFPTISFCKSFSILLFTQFPQNFYFRQDVAKVLPHKRYATKRGPGRVMLMTLHEAFMQFKVIFIFIIFTISNLYVYYYFWFSAFYMVFCRIGQHSILWLFLSIDCIQLHFCSCTIQFSCHVMIIEDNFFFRHHTQMLLLGFQHLPNWDPRLWEKLAKSAQRHVSVYTVSTWDSKLETLNRVLAAAGEKFRFPSETKMLDFLLCRKSGTWHEMDCLTGKKFFLFKSDMSIYIVFNTLVCHSSK